MYFDVFHAEAKLWKASSLEKYLFGPFNLASMDAHWLYNKNITPSPPLWFHTLEIHFMQTSALAVFQSKKKKSDYYD